MSEKKEIDESSPFDILDLNNENSIYTRSALISWYKRLNRKRVIFAYKITDQCEHALSYKYVLPAALGPVILATVVGRRELLQLGGPEPAVDATGQQIRPVAAFEIAETTRGPDILHLIYKWNVIRYFVILCFCFHKYRCNLQNHAYFERCGFWWTRSRRRFPAKLGPYNVVGRSF